MEDGKLSNLSDITAEVVQLPFRGGRSRRSFEAIGTKRFVQAAFKSSTATINSLLVRMVKTFFF
jgi:hypothetical protein